MNELELIQSLWIGDKLSKIERLCIESYLQNGHQFHLYTYGEIENIPKGVKIKDGNDIISESEIFKDNRGITASFADWFRYKLLYEKGNCWTDMDMICLKPIYIAREFYFSSEVQPQGGSAANIGFMKAPKGSEFFLDLLTSVEKIKSAKVKWGKLGPELLQFVLGHYEASMYIAPPEVFCPLPFWSFREVIEENKNLTFPNETLTIHLWNEMWRLYSLDKNQKYPFTSLLEQMKRKYQVF